MGKITAPADKSHFRIGIAQLTSTPYVFEISTELIGPGSYAIQVVAEDDGGLKASDEIEVRVDDLELPPVHTGSISSLSSISVQIFGQVSADGGSAVSERGICWNTEGDPSLLDSYVTRGEGLGHSSDTISGLECNTSYYFRAYATNEVGFTALPSGYRTTEGIFYNLGLTGYFRSANEARSENSYVYWLYHNYIDVHSLVPYNDQGYSVRCVKD